MLFVCFFPLILFFPFLGPLHLLCAVFFFKADRFVPQVFPLLCTFPHINSDLFSRNLLIFVSLYIDAIIFFSYSVVMIVNLLLKNSKTAVKK